MNEQEAIERIKKLKYFTELVNTPEEFFHHMQGHTKELSLVLVAFDVSEISEMIIEALEKQMPKKPLKGGNHLSDDIYNLCPVCSRLIGVNYDVNNRTDYCPDCGQKIDWSVEV